MNKISVLLSLLLLSLTTISHAILVDVVSGEQYPTRRGYEEGTPDLIDGTRLTLEGICVKMGTQL